MHENARLSHSSIETLNQCPRKWHWNYILELDTGAPENEAAVIGNMVHSILESLYGHAHQDRSADNARTIARDRWGSFTDTYQEKVQEEIPETLKHQVWAALEGIFHMEDPSKVNVYAIEKSFDLQFRGLKMRGFIDRIEYGQDDELVIVDFKSGNKPKRLDYVPKKLMQLYIYAWALDQEDIQVSEAKLYYTAHRQIISTKITDENIEVAENYLHAAVDKLEKFFTEDDFPPAPSMLCGWCPFIGQCPEGEEAFWKFSNMGKMKASAPAYVALMPPSLPPPSWEPDDPFLGLN
jgi:putative RecB family exonuclease